MLSKMKILTSEFLHYDVTLNHDDLLFAGINLYLIFFHVCSFYSKRFKVQNIISTVNPKLASV